jgi:hypothetical protein
MGAESSGNLEKEYGEGTAAKVEELERDSYGEITWIERVIRTIDCARMLRSRA